MAHSRELEAGLASAQAAEQKVRTQAAGLEVQRREKQAAAAALEARQGELVRDRQQLLQQMAWRRELLARLEAEAADLDAREAGLQASLDRLADEGQRRHR
jgi:hypothetical protein